MAAQVNLDERRNEPLLRLHARLFVERFGAGAAPRLFFSPGRVNLMGAHLDYNGGPVMPTVIDRGTFFALRPRRDRNVRFAATLDSGVVEVELDALPERRAGRWADYPIGVLIETARLARERGQAGALHGLDVLFGGNLPVGAGLSSSASICVGTALALGEVFGLGLDRADWVEIALRAERSFVGVQCGIMDPYAVGMARAGHLLWLDCKDRSVAHLPLDPARVSIAVADTLVRRELAQGAFNERVRQCAHAFELLAPHQPGATCLRDIQLAVFEQHAGLLPTECRSRAHHVIHEVARTLTARAALERGDEAAFGIEMTRAHASLRDHFEVSVAELDQLVESATRETGCLGARLTGAGFGGCAVMLLRKGAEFDVAARLEREFEKRFGRRPTLEFFDGDVGPREVVLD